MSPCQLFFSRISVILSPKAQVGRIFIEMFVLSIFVCIYAFTND